MGVNFISIDDVYFNHGRIGLNINNLYNEAMLVSKELQMKCSIKDNLINLKDLITLNNIFMPNQGLYELKIFDGSPQMLIVNVAPVSGKEYICKDYAINIDNATYTIDVYINNLNRVKIKISKEINNTLNELNLYNSIENIQVNKEKLFFNLYMSFKDATNENLQNKTYTPDHVSFCLYDKSLSHVVYVEPKSCKKNIYEFEFDLLTILKDDVKEMKFILIVNGEVSNYSLPSKIKLKAIPLVDDNDLKFAELATTSDSISLKTISKLKVNPVISSATYANRVSFSGDLNYNYNFIQSDKYALNIVIVSKDLKVEIQKNIIINGNQFEFYLNEEDIRQMKEYSPEIWSIYLQVDKDNDENNRYRVKFKDSKKNALLTKDLLMNNENIIFKVYLTKTKSDLIIQVKNNITITKVLYILYKNNELEIKYRTKENIEDLLDSKKIDTIIFNEFGRFKQNKLKKIGKQTFISYYTGDNVEDFIQEAKKRGINVQIKTNNDTYLSHIKEIDSDTLYSSDWEKIQRTKRYKKVCEILYNKIFLNLPVKNNRIMLESFLGRNVSGNPKYLYQQLVSDDLDKKYELIWILNNLDEPIEGNCKKVKRKSLMYYYYMATAKYWFFNCRQSDEIKKREENIYLQTWHGTPLKKLGMDMDNVNMAGQTDINDYKRKFYDNSRRWDYLLAQNDYSKEIFKRAFSFDKTILEGYPANDILYNKNNAEDILEIKRKLEIPQDKKVILYAPTWRDNNFYKKGHYRMSIELDLDKMQKELGNEYIILLRMHYLITNNLNIEKYQGFVYDYSQGYDIQELYLVSDILITDYSSVMFDYSNLNRPIIFFTYDIEQYRDSLRGFYFDFEREAPGPLVTDTEGVIEAIKSLDELNQKYENKRKAFYNKFCHIDNGSAASNILKEVLKIE